MEVVGVPVRVLDMDGDDLGVAYVPPIVRVGDVLTVNGRMFEIFNVIESDAALLTAIVHVRPVTGQQAWELERGRD
jgi:hypothetical protein